MKQRRTQVTPQRFALSQQQAKLLGPIKNDDDARRVLSAAAYERFRALLEINPRRVDIAVVGALASTPEPGFRFPTSQPAQRVMSGPLVPIRADVRRRLTGGKRFVMYGPGAFL